MRNRNAVLPSCELKFMLRRKLDQMKRDLDAMYLLLKDIEWEQEKNELL